MEFSQTNLELMLSRYNYFSNVFYFSQLESTNNYAKHPEIPDKSFILTDFQTKGRGRLDKIWISDKGKNLTFTIKQKFNYPYSEQHTVNFYFTYCIAQALENYLSDKILNFNKINEIEVKWPNDVLLRGKKICGILIENSKSNYIIGIGLNVNQLKFCINKKYNITSLRKEFNIIFNKSEVLDSIIKVVTDNINLINTKKSSVIYNLWSQKFKMKDKIVKIDNIEGIVKGVSKDGSIVITVNNVNKKYYTGELSIKS